MTSATDPAARRRYGRAIGPLVVLEHAVGIELACALDQSGDQAAPPGLVGSTEPGPVIAVVVLVEQDEVTPVRVLLE